MKGILASPLFREQLSPVVELLLKLFVEVGENGFIFSRILVFSKGGNAGSGVTCFYSKFT